MSEVPRDPTSRQAWVKDFVEGKFGKSPIPREPTPQEKVFIQAEKITHQVERNSAIPLLKALQSPADYQRAGTQRFLFDEFQRKFSLMSKDELVFLMAAMHAEILEGQCNQIVQQGRIGENYGKPI